MLNLQMFYLIPGNFAILESSFHRVPTPQKVFVFLFCCCCFFLPKPQVIQKIVIYLCILPYEPLHLSETYGLLTHWLMLIYSVLRFLKEKGYKSQHI